VILETDRLVFRAHTIDDLDAFCAMQMDAEFRRFVGGRPRTRQEAEERFRQQLAAHGGMRLWATLLKADDRYIGYSGIYPHTADGVRLADEGVLACYIARAFWGRGLATEAARAFVEFGFGPLGLSRIVASADADHAASRRVLAKLGFREVGVTVHGSRRIHEYEQRRPSTGGTVRV
jgi:RimJ/RimL family protein N-acetyltransferase